MEAVAATLAAPAGAPHSSTVTPHENAKEQFAQAIKEQERRNYDEANRLMAQALGKLTLDDLEELEEGAGFFSIYEQLADSGNELAMFLAGRCLQDGRDCGAVDTERAATYYKRAAEADHGLSMLAYGNCLDGGIGVGQNILEALTWLGKGARAVARLSA